MSILSCAIFRSAPFRRRWARGVRPGGPAKTVPARSVRSEAAKPFSRGAPSLPRIAMKVRVKAIYRNLKTPVDAIVFSNSTDPHIDLSFFYATGLTDGLFEGCTAWLFPDGRCEIVTSALEEEAARKSGLPLHLFRNRAERLAALRSRVKGLRPLGINQS